MVAPSPLKMLFRPHPAVRGGNFQTLFSAIYPWRRAVLAGRRRLIDLDDGDRLMLHDDEPRGWQPQDRSALLVHGLGGSHASPYIELAAQKLIAEGVRTFRLDLRGCGAGEDYARGAAHCGSWPDVQAAVEHIAEVCPHSPLHMIGYSLGGSLALNLAGEVGDSRCGNLASVLAVCPPVDLHELDKAFSRGAGRVYSRHYCRVMWRHILDRLKTMENPPEVDTSRVPRSIRELDEQITAPYHGYASADAYYTHASAGQRLTSINLPTKVIAAADDPVIPVRSFGSYPLSNTIEVNVTPSGGHLGFFGRHGTDPDRRWIDWRVVDWVTGRVGPASTGSVAKSA